MSKGARFWAKVDTTADCWVWTAFKDRRGYGRFHIAGRSTNALAHRVAYEFIVGPILQGYELDHLCRNPSCVNPAHLEPVTHIENVRRGLSAVTNIGHTKKTRCPQGHPYSTENTYRYKGERHCRACARTRAREAYQLGRSTRVITDKAV